MEDATTPNRRRPPHAEQRARRHSHHPAQKELGELLVEIDLKRRHQQSHQMITDVGASSRSPAENLTGAPRRRTRRRSSGRLRHDVPWEKGNHEDGYLMGLGNLQRLWPKVVEGL